MSRKSRFRIVYFIIAASAFYYVAIKLLNFEQWDFIHNNFINDNWGFLVTTQVILWGINIGLESFRWKYLLSSFSGYSFFNSLKMVIVSFAAGGATPMKIGEHGGKIVYMKKDDQATGIMASLYGSYLNSAVLLLIAAFTVPFLLTYKKIALPISAEFSKTALIILMIIILTVSYFLILFLFKQIKKRIRNTGWAVKTGFFDNFKLKRALFLFFITLLRIMTYNIQLYIWFRFFNISCPVSIFFLLSPAYFAVITLIPAMFLLDLGIRGSVGLFLFSSLCGNTAAVISAIFSLWFINVAIPVLWGSLLLLFKEYHQ